MFAQAAYAEQEELKDTPKAREVAVDILLFHTPVKKRFISYLEANTSKLNEDERAEFISNTMSNAPWGKLRKIYLQTYVENYTLKELIKLIELAESPEGKEIIYKEPFVSRKIKPGLEGIVDAILSERREMPEAPPAPPVRPPPPPDEQI